MRYPRPVESAPIERSDEPGDAELIAALQAGDQRALSVLFDRYAAHVQRILTRVLGTDNDLPDLHSQVFVHLFDSVSRIRDPRGLKSWLTTAAVFVARKHIRSRQRRRWLVFLPASEVPEPEPGAPSASTAEAEALKLTFEILGRLPADERIAFSLRFIDGMELTEVAEACGVSLATIKRRLARAQEQFLKAAGRHPELRPWLEGGGRWANTNNR